MAVSHVFSNAVPDATGTVTVWYGSTTASVAASDIVLPSHWNSAHNQVVTLSGNTAGVSSITGTNIVFGGSNNITLSGVQGANAGTINVVAAAPADGVNIIAAGTQTADTTGTVVFSNSNRVTFGMSNNSQITASIDAAGTGTTFAGTNASASITLNSNGLNMALSAAAGGGGVTISHLSNNVPNVFANSNGLVSNARLIFPFHVFQDASLSYGQFNVSMGTNSTSFGTTANTSMSGGNYWTFYLQVFSLGTGTQSNSFINVFTTSQPYAIAQSLTAGPSGSQYTVGNTLTYPHASGGTSSSSLTYEVSQTRFDFSTSQLTQFSGFRVFNFPFATSLGAGVYFMAPFFSSTTSATGAAGITDFIFRPQFIGLISASMGSRLFGDTGGGGFSNASLVGNWSTNVATVDSLPVSALTSRGTANNLALNFIRIA